MKSLLAFLHKAYSGLRALCSYRLCMFFCIIFSFMLISCDAEPSPPSISDLSVNALVEKIKMSGGNDQACMEELLSRTGPEAAEAQEEVGDFFELHDYAISERCWQSAREHGRLGAGPKLPVGILVEKIKESGGENRAAFDGLLSREGTEAAAAQEAVGDFFEVEDYELAERCWQAAREHGLVNAGPNHWAVTRWVIRNKVLCLVLAVFVVVVGFFLVRSCISSGDAQDFRRYEGVPFQRGRKSHSSEGKTYAVSNTSWWHIPDNSSLYFDTCVLMCFDEGKRGVLMFRHGAPVSGVRANGFDAWLEWIATNAKERGWKLCIIRDVYAEILKHKREGNQVQQRGARMAVRRIEKMQKLAGVCVQLEAAEIRAPYADPKLSKCVVDDPMAILFTNDRPLAIGVRSEVMKLRGEAASMSQVRMLVDFESCSGSGGSAVRSI